ncbi:hypothetical protein QBC44DRAFT_375589 [Cladorrhinum sp. PSN332]|nr:hypothetical protein QBC44DRAFT_375589 [Cladorrhinum sp. PSN332]
MCYRINVVYSCHDDCTYAKDISYKAPTEVQVELPAEQGREGETGRIATHLFSWSSPGKRHLLPLDYCDRAETSGDEVQGISKKVCDKVHDAYRFHPLRCSNCRSAFRRRLRLSEDEKKVIRSRWEPRFESAWNKQQAGKAFEAWFNKLVMREYDAQEKDAMTWWMAARIGFVPDQPSKRVDYSSILNVRSSLINNCMAIDLRVLRNTPPFMMNWDTCEMHIQEGEGIEIEDDCADEGEVVSSAGDIHSLNSE